MGCRGDLQPQSVSSPFLRAFHVRVEPLNEARDVRKQHRPYAAAPDHHDESPLVPSNRPTGPQLPEEPRYQAVEIIVVVGVYKSSQEVVPNAEGLQFLT